MKRACPEQTDEDFEAFYFMNTFFVAAAAATSGALEDNPNESDSDNENDADEMEALVKLFTQLTQFTVTSYTVRISKICFKRQ